MSTTKAIGGGLLSGLGSGMVADAESKREAALLFAKQQREDRHRQEDRDWDMKRDEKNHERDKGLLSRTVTAEDGSVYGITRGMDKKDLGIKADISSGSGVGDGDGFGFAMSAEEQRLYKEIKDRYTNPQTDKVDWQNLINHLRQMPAERGGQRWNEIADHLTGSIGARMSATEASEAAEREARERGPGLMNRIPGLGQDEDPWEGAGSREAWVKQRASQLRGGGGGGGTGGGSKPQASSGQAASTAPPGQGTQGNPYKATSQAHIDWFKQQAPEGAVIEANGTLYVK